MKSKRIRILKATVSKRRYAILCFILVASLGCLVLFRRVLISRTENMEYLQNSLQKTPHVFTDVMHEREPNDIRQRFGQRHQLVSQFCKKNRDQYDKIMDNCTKTNPVEQYSYSLTQYNLVICVIPYNADIILKQTLQMLVTSSEGKSKMKNPFVVTDYALSRYSLRRQKLSISELIKSGFSNRFTIVRDPYARILSFYIDHLYLPNSWAWRTLATNIRPSDQRSCISNVTFSEFVDFFIKSVSKYPCSSDLLHLNTHYSDPCSMQYYYIGKYETLENDLDFILTELDLMKFLSIPHFKTDYETLEITRYVNSLYGQIEDTLQDCEMDFTMAANRVWRILQGKGIMGRYDALPLTSDKIQQSKMQTLMLSSYVNGQQFDRVDNSKILLSEAYSKVSLKAIEELQRIFKLDFEIYGYEPYPDFIRKAQNKQFKPKFLDLD